MDQFTEAQAIAIYNSGIWQDMTEKQICDMQLLQDRLCVPLDILHDAMNVCLGRPITNLELLTQRSELTREYILKNGKPSCEDVMALLIDNQIIKLNQ